MYAENGENETSNQQSGPHGKRVSVALKPLICLVLRKVNDQQAPGLKSKSQLRGLEVARNKVNFARGAR